ncbi:arylsulfatase [Horticoccus luteus]|uniref:Arylsulfatase n=1 Tax=Horticoccus luteus TaxID=2862869 RepID=A0A8F9TT77_9BACT|nr:arylsulfatase [Horticoccus luteus]QYM78615.1 arylsulfatase [Horticoccus luteus]
MKTNVSVFAVALVLVAVTGLRGAPSAPAPRPNILFLLADDQGWGDVGFHGSEIRTPNIDRLAKEGARLEQFYVQPLCSPTRAALLTGRYPIRYGLQIGVVRPFAQYGLPLDERTLAQALHDVGYETAITGKWHLGLVKPAYLPTHRGFEHQYGLYNGNFDYFTHRRDGGLDWHRDDHALHEEGYSTTLIAQEASRIIAAHDPGRPLFLYVPFNAVHGPWQVPESYEAPYQTMTGRRRIYAGMVAAMDEGIGQILRTLDEKGLRENTLIVFCSDNGGPLPGVVTSNGPLRGGKGSLYEGGVRVPAVVVWDGKIKAGSVVPAVLHMVDWFPTLAKLAGAQSPSTDHPLDGRDAWPTIAACAASPHEDILLNITTTGGAVRIGDWKLVVNGQVKDGEEGGTVTEARKDLKAQALAAPVIELFDLRSDPNETTNLAAKNPEKVAELQRKLSAYAKAAVPSKQAPISRDFKVPAVWGEP